MPYCPDCAVEVDDSVKTCPLCGVYVQKDPVEPATLFPSLTDNPVKIILPWDQLRGRIFAPFGGDQCLKYAT